MDVSYTQYTGDTDDSEDNPVKIHVPPASKVSRWSHIEDLDLFFSRLYAYHQKNGFFCIFVRGVFELQKVLFMIVFLVFLLNFVDYDILFKNKLLPNHNTTDPLQKVSITDSFCSWSDCSSKITGFTWICIAIVLIYWVFRFIKLAYNLYHFWDTKGFFNIALGIPDNELSNITWHEVQKKICEVQIEHQMCIRKKDLTELDIYHRILRSKNYLVAMINKSILPTHYNIPLIGNAAYLSQGLKYNVELLLFSGTWGLFENWHLKEDYKKFSKRHELAAKLQSNITWFALINLALGVFIFIWQLVYFFFNYAELLKREPGVLALRYWSLYGRLYLRHFNELDHELDARLRRAYRPASKYMNTFFSSIMVILAENIIFQAGAIFIVLVCLSIYDEDILAVEHVLLIISILGAVLALMRKIIPDENCCWNPETLMTEILSEVHYLPDSWRGQAHTTLVRDQFSQLFQYKAVYLIYEVISPILVPIIFYFKLRPKSLEIIDFYRNFTVSVLGVGDVCSFSLMDMRKHGNALWQVPGHVKCAENNKQTQAEDGKTELSLIHFVTMNPAWQPPQEAEQFICKVKEKVLNPDEFLKDSEIDKHSEALDSISTSAIYVFFMNYCIFLQLSMIASQQLHQPVTSVSRVNFMRRNRLEGPITSSSYFFKHVFQIYLVELIFKLKIIPVFGNSDSVYGSSNNRDKLITISGAPDIDMSLKTLYLHSVHHKMLLSNPDYASDSALISRPSINAGVFPTPSTSSRNTDVERIYERTPLLNNVPKRT
ncbi:hypothetical protein PGB90_003148 [Kerria lacca]